MRLLPNTKYYFVPLCLRGYIYIKLAHFYRIFVKNFGGRVYKFLSAMEKKFLIFSKRARKNLRKLTKNHPPVHLYPVRCPLDYLIGVFTCSPLRRPFSPCFLCVSGYNFPDFLEKATKGKRNSKYKQELFDITVGFYYTYKALVSDCRHSKRLIRELVW